VLELLELLELLEFGLGFLELALFELGFPVDGEFGSGLLELGLFELDFRAEHSKKVLGPAPSLETLQKTVERFEIVEVADFE
jgi:hypothetical protein